MKLNKKLYQPVGWVVLGAAVLVGTYFWAKGVSVPESFNKSREQAAMAARDIVGTTELSLKNLDSIALQDRQYNFKEALVLVRGELSRSKISRQKAVELTRELNKMTRAAVGITPLKLRNLAVEAISNELSLISHLIVYNDALNGLLQTLEFKFSGDIRYDSQEVQSLVKNMNQEAREINKLNDLFNEKMRQFDELVNS